MQRTSLVTGGSGYFGSLLVKMLLDAGDEVRVLDLFDADDRPTQVEFLQGDIRDPAAVRRACQGVDAVHHNVAQVPLARDNKGRIVRFAAQVEAPLWIADGEAMFERRSPRL